MWDNLPWMLGGNVEHSASQIRAASYVFCGGRPGVVGAADLSVTALASPGPSVRVAPGALAVLASQGGFEMYTGRHLATENVAIAATGGAARTDLIIARVEDPYFTGSPWPNPDAQGNDPVARQGANYWYIRVISGVPAATTKLSDIGRNDSAIVLAKVTQPAGNTNITQAMITDLRPQTGINSEDVGVIKMWPAYTPPANHLTLDGSTFSSTVFPSLAALLGDTFGVHAGTTYYLPDPRRRSIVADGPGLGIGSTEGIADASARDVKHRHVTPSHGHHVQPHGHTGGVQIFAQSAGVPSGSGGGQRIQSLLNTAMQIDPQPLDTDGSGDLNTTETSNGPYLALRLIIRAA